MKQRIQLFLINYHPIVRILLLGTILARAASSMSLPFLAIYLSVHSHLSAVEVGLIIGMGALASTIGGFFGGALSDRFGRKLIMLGALYMWGFVFIGFGFAANAWLFLLLNLLNGLCRSFFEPVSQALMADLTKPELRFRVFSMRYLAINIGVAVGPLLGAYFAIISGGLPFTITGFVYLIYAVLLQVLLDHFGIKQIEGKEKGAETVTFRKAWDVIRQDVTFRLFLLGGMISMIGYSQMTAALAQYLQQNIAGGVSIFAALMSTNAIVVVLFQVPVGRWIEKKTPLFAIVLGSIMFALGDIGFAFSIGWITFIASMAVFTFGEILCYPAVNLLVDRLAPEEMRGSYYGAQSFQNFGAFVGPWIGGALLISFGGSVLFAIIAVITLYSISLYWLGVKRLAYQAAPLTQTSSNNTG